MSEPVPETTTPNTAADAPQTDKPKKVNPKEARLAARLAEEQALAKEKAEALLKYAAVFGSAGIIQSTGYQTKAYRTLASLSAADAGSTVVLRARLHTSRKKGKLAFVVLRDNGESVQCIASVDEKTPKEMIDFMGQIPCESVVDVSAAVCKVENPITSTTKSEIELRVETIHVISESARTLPFQLEDAARRDDAEGIKVNQDTRLACRWMDMRTPASNAIFRLQSRVGQYFREFLLDQDFVEIHSPKMIGAASEGGANVFKLNYFSRDAFLAQSPQLYKQMAVQGDLKRVFEVAPVFRAENSNTHRHLTEFVGLDMEMAINEHYYEVLDMAEGVFDFMFRKLALCKPELDAVNNQYPFDPLVHQVPEELIDALGVGVIDEKREPTDEYRARIHNRAVRMLRIPYASCIALLNTILPDGEKMEETDDINTTNEKKLGGLVKQRYGVDWFVSDRFPSVCRPFYTMPCPDDARFTNSYDMFIRGEEISSGAQRIHDADMLLERAKKLGVDLAPLKDYVDSFRLGAWPHGGFGVGLERVVMLYLGLHNIRFASLFPRDPQRCSP